VKPHFVVLPVVSGCLCACANLNSIYRPVEIGSNSNGQAIALDIKQRAIFSMPRKVASNGVEVSSVVVCAEPSSDALAVNSVGGGLGVTGTSGPQVQGALATGESAASVGLRTQSIQLLRDGLFSNCMSYLGGGLAPDEFYELQRRSQNFTLGLLAIEQLTGAVKAQQATLASNASASTGSENTDKETAALDDARKQLVDAQKALDQGKLDLESARKAASDQAVKVTSARKAKAALAKDASDASKSDAQGTLDAEQATLVARQHDVDSARIQVNALSQAAANAGASVAAAQSALVRAQGRASASAAGAAALGEAGGTPAAVAREVSDAVVLIVKSVLNESGRGEQCNAAIGKSLTLPDPQRGQLIAQACSPSETAAVASSAADPAASKILLKAVQDAETYRRKSKSDDGGSMPAPAPAPPPPADPRPKE